MGVREEDEGVDSNRPRPAAWREDRLVAFPASVAGHGAPEPSFEALENPFSFRARVEPISPPCLCGKNKRNDAISGKTTTKMKI